MLTSISNRSLVFIILTSILVLCLSSSSFFLGSRLPSSSTIPTFFGWSPSIETQYSSILGPNIDKLPTQDEAIQLFQLWKKEHGRVYNDLEEMGKKFDIFLSNLKYITESNAKSHESFYGLTNFADWSIKEFKELYLHNIDIPATANNITEMHDADNISVLPASIDWRSKGKEAVTSVKIQYPCGCCWAFSAVGAVEGITKIKTGKLIDLSAQELVDCDPNSSGCSGGWVDKAFEWIIKNGGIGSELDYPFLGKEGDCKASKTPNSATIDGYRVVTSGSENAMLTATATQPISVYIWAADDFLHYKSNKIYDGPNCDENSTRINHVVLIVGYGSENGKDYWIVKNSWSTGWGDNGYIRIQRNTGKKHGVCAINVYAYYPIKNGIATI